MQPFRKAESLIGQCNFSQGTFLWAHQHFCVLNNLWKHLKILLNVLYIIFSSQNVVVRDLAPVQPQFSLLPYMLSKLQSSKLLAVMLRGHTSPHLPLHMVSSMQQMPLPLVSLVKSSMFRAFECCFLCKTFPLPPPIPLHKTWLFSPLHFQCTMYISQIKYIFGILL